MNIFLTNEIDSVKNSKKINEIQIFFENSLKIANSFEDFKVLYLLSSKEFATMMKNLLLFTKNFSILKLNEFFKLDQKFISAHKYLQDLDE